MSIRVLFPAVAAMALGVSAIGAQAAPIDLADKGLKLTSNVLEGFGVSLFDSASGIFSEDFLAPFGLDDFAFSEVQLLADDVIDGNDVVNVFYDGLFFPGNEELFTITAMGDNEVDTIEFLLARDFADLPITNDGMGENVLLRVVSAQFDFSSLDPFDFFAQEAALVGGEFLAEADFSLISLAPIPVPASLPLLLAGFGALGFAARRKRHPATA